MHFRSPKTVLVKEALDVRKAVSVALAPYRIATAVTPSPTLGGETVSRVVRRPTGEIGRGGERIMKDITETVQKPGPYAEPIEHAQNIIAGGLYGAVPGAATGAISGAEEGDVTEGAIRGAIAGTLAGMLVGGAGSYALDSAMPAMLGAPAGAVVGGAAGHGAAPDPVKESMALLTKAAGAILARDHVKIASDLDNRLEKLSEDQVVALCRSYLEKTAAGIEPDELEKRAISVMQTGRGLWGAAKGLLGRGTGEVAETSGKRMFESTLRPNAWERVVSGFRAGKAKTVPTKWEKAMADEVPTGELLPSGAGVRTAGGGVARGKELGGHGEELVFPGGGTMGGGGTRLGKEVAEEAERQGIDPTALLTGLGVMGVGGLGTYGGYKYLTSPQMQAKRQERAQQLAMQQAQQQAMLQSHYG